MDGVRYATGLPPRQPGDEENGPSDVLAVRGRRTHSYCGGRRGPVWTGQLVTISESTLTKIDDAIRTNTERVVTGLNDIAQLLRKRLDDIDEKLNAKLDAGICNYEGAGQFDGMPGEFTFVGELKHGLVPITPGRSVMTDRATQTGSTTVDPKRLDPETSGGCKTCGGRRCDLSRHQRRDPSRHAIPLELRVAEALTSPISFAGEMVSNLVDSKRKRKKK